MKEQIKEYMINKFGHFPQDLDQLTEFIGGFNASLAPSVSDEEIKRDIKREAELYQSDPAKTSFEISRAEYFAFCEGAKWMRDNHLPSKGDEVCPKCGDTGRCEPQTLDSPDGQECNHHLPQTEEWEKALVILKEYFVIDKIISEEYLIKIAKAIAEATHPPQTASLGMLVWHKEIYKGNERMKIVGIRETSVELEGDYSGGTHNVCQRDWYSKEGLIFDKEQALNNKDK